MACWRHFTAHCSKGTEEQASWKKESRVGCGLPLRACLHRRFHYCGCIGGRATLPRAALKPLSLGGNRSIPSPSDSRQRSLIRRRRQLSQAIREMPTPKRTRHNMEFHSSSIAEKHLPQRRAKADTSGDVEFELPLDRDIEGCWRRMVLRPLLACSAETSLQKAGHLCWDLFAGREIADFHDSRASNFCSNISHLESRCG